MQLNTVIFDMDGLIINSEPFWQEAAVEALDQFDVALTQDQYHQTMGLRSKEWLEYWFNYFRLDISLAKAAGEDIVVRGIEKIRDRAEAMPGVYEALAFFQKRNFKIGLATSSPAALIEVVVDKLDIRHFFKALTSAEKLAFGKPHPEVYLICASLLQSDPQECLCFEDSFNGMIAVKAARMKCIVVPDAGHLDLPQWGAADIKLPSLSHFSESHLESLS
jgi:sugar-phosphatase